MRSSAEDAPVAVDRAPPLAARSILADAAALSPLSAALRNIDSPAVWPVVSPLAACLLERKKSEAPETDADADAEADAETEADALPSPPPSVVSDTTEKMPPCDDEAMVLSRS